jgi:hypothetical protein
MAITLPLGPNANSDKSLTGESKKCQLGGLIKEIAPEAWPFSADPGVCVFSEARAAIRGITSSIV